MSSHKHVRKSPLSFLSLVGRTLYALGQPPLFALKILLWTVYWIGNNALNLLAAAIHLVIGVLDTIVWIADTYRLAFVQAFKLTSDKIVKLRSKFLLPSQVKNLPAHGRTFISNLKVISLPAIPAMPPIPKPQLQNATALQKTAYLFLGAAAAFVFIFIPVWVKSELDQLPDPKLLAARHIPVSTKIYDRSGILLYQIYSDENRTMVSLKDLPEFVSAATIAIEDRNFYFHPGFDLAGITRAAFANSNGEITQGGSTITQQLIRSALLSPDRTWERKIKEIILSFWAERIYSKDQILTMYLNQVPYGGAAYGIDAAAQTYFNKHTKDLSLGEAALLAGLTSAPSTYSPFGTRPDLAKQRQQQVLEAMVAQGYIRPEQMADALDQPLQFAPMETAIKAPHFVMYVRDYLTRKYGSRVAEQGGLEVTTSLDYQTYETVTKLLKDGVAAQQNLNVGNGAALVTNPKTGEILAMAGSVDFFDLAHDGNVNVTVAQRSPGSSIKPLNYALGLEKKIITPSTIIDDSPVRYRFTGGPDYTPQNYDSRFHGRVSVRTALGSSYNIPAVKVLEKNGVQNFIDFARKMGITTWTDSSRYGLALTLGGGEVTMTDMATAYSAFAAGGRRVDLNPILKITDYRGKVLEDNTNHQPLGNQVISPQTAFLISDILADNHARTPAFGPVSALVIPNHTVSVKTGTTQDKRDNWTIGYTPSLLVAVWVGNNNNSPMSPALESGNTGAAAIWNPIMRELLATKPDEGITKPDNLVPVQVCSLNGSLPCENCPSVRTEYFVKGTEPKNACSFTKEEVEKILHPQNQN